MTLTLTLCVQLVIALAVGAGLIAACRWVQRRSPLCGWVVVSGVLLRAVVTLFLFWTSYLNLPILRQLHTGDGFWTLAIDATIYYDAALDANEDGLDSVTRGSASPAFVKGLTLWMRAVGFSRASARTEPLVARVALRDDCRGVQARRPLAGGCAVRRHAGGGVVLPGAGRLGSQPMKDSTFVFLIGTICVAAYEFLPSLTSSGEGLAVRSRQDWASPRCSWRLCA